MLNPQLQKALSFKYVVAELRRGHYFKHKQFEHHRTQLVEERDTRKSFCRQGFEFQ